MRESKWTPEIVIAKIKYRAQKGLKYNCFYVQKHKRCAALYRGAVYCFGTWNKALSAAGVPVPHRNQWSKEAIIAKIQELAVQGEALYNSYIKANHGILYTVACQYFGGWGKAVTAAGLDYDSIRLKKLRFWSKQAIVKEITRRYEAGLTVTSSGVQREDPGLYDAATLHFGKPNAWAQARLAAGLVAVDPHPKYNYTKEMWCAEILRLYVSGTELNIGAMIGTPHAHLMSVGKRLFGSYRQAINSAGLDYQTICKNQKNWWTKKRVGSHIKDLERRGVKLCFSAIYAENSALYSAAIRHFGSWRAALKSCCVNYQKHTRSWSSKDWVDSLSDEKYSEILETATEHAIQRRST